MLRKFWILLFVVILAVSLMFFRYLLAGSNSQNQNKQLFALLGDVGGTNIRLQLVSFRAQQKTFAPHQKKKFFQQIKMERMKVKNFTSFQAAIQHFLSDIKKQSYPAIAVIGMAGPISNNSLRLPNVPQWGKLQGNRLGQSLKIANFQLINDFQAISYGILVVPQTQMISLNGKSIDHMKKIGVIGPGTGLGHSILLRDEKAKQQIVVLPSQAGHTDFPIIDDQAIEYFNFVKKERNLTYVSLEKSFCGPAIPFIHKFYSKKYQPNSEYRNLTSEFIFQQALKDNSSIVFKKTIEMFLKIYSAAIGNFLAQHLCQGGIYLVGSVTKAILPILKKTQILKQWKQRHPQVCEQVDRIPIVFCNQVDLGLKGAFVVAKNIYKSSINKKKPQYPKTQQQESSLL